MKPPKTTVLILGRNGDIIQLLPAFQAISKRDENRVRVLTSTEYRSVFDGVSYVEVFSIHSKWDEGIPAARDMARGRFGSCIVPQFWLETDRAPGPTPQTPMLNCKGVQWPVDLAADPDYGSAMWRRLGLTREDMMRLPLVFDQRDHAREEWLRIRYTRVKKKPLLLVHFQGVSSPFAPHPEVMSAIGQLNGFEIVDLGKIWFDHIYDALGLMEIAAGMVLCDSAFLHLAPATTTPYLAYTQNGWSGSRPKGNCMIEIKYADALAKMDEIKEFLGFISTQESKSAETLLTLTGSR